MNIPTTTADSDFRIAPPVRQSKKDSPPVFWAEVYSRPDSRWLPVNPLTATVDKNRVFEPAPGDKFNRMLYVVAFEEGTSFAPPAIYELKDLLPQMVIFVTSLHDMPRTMLLKCSRNVRQVNVQTGGVWCYLFSLGRTAL